LILCSNLYVVEYVTLSDQFIFVLHKICSISVSHGLCLRFRMIFCHSIPFTSRGIVKLKLCWRPLKHRPNTALYHIIMFEHPAGTNLPGHTRLFEDQGIQSCYNNCTNPQLLNRCPAELHLLINGWQIDRGWLFYLQCNCNIPRNEHIGLILRVVL
jgi:hypothetical protein